MFHPILRSFHTNTLLFGSAHHTDEHTHTYTYSYSTSYYEFTTSYYSELTYKHNLCVLL